MLRLAVSAAHNMGVNTGTWVFSGTCVCRYLVVCRYLTIRGALGQHMMDSWIVGIFRISNYPEYPFGITPLYK